MKAVLQRAATASVSVGGEVVGEIDRPGLVALVAAHREDTRADIEKMAARIMNLRILDEEKSVRETDAPVLLVSQFTLYGRTKKGARPSWMDAASGQVAEPMIDDLVQLLRDEGVEVATGVFGAMMQVSLVNDGPFTVIVDTRE
ncbi:D-aminoacyl-tRNA deacylase [Actinomycetaceae bacterium MB13-C1-2]|nr:D-aminoacyl-tRNA deacylase [Actinomycetaceae bacterium MB13-C1-2]